MDEPFLVHVICPGAGSLIFYDDLNRVKFKWEASKELQADLLKRLDKIHKPVTQGKHLMLVEGLAAEVLSRFIYEIWEQHDITFTKLAEQQGVTSRESL